MLEMYGAIHQEETAFLLALMTAFFALALRNELLGDTMVQLCKMQQQIFPSSKFDSEHYVVYRNVNYKMNFNLNYKDYFYFYLIISLLIVSCLYCQYFSSSLVISSIILMIRYCLK